MHNYEIKLEKIRVGDADFVVRSLKDRQQFYDPHGICEKAGVSPATWPLFGVLWPSAIVLADIMDSYPIEGLRILEIGCGLALGSLVVHRRGGDVTASDYHPLAGSFLKENIALNHFPPLPFENSDWSKVNPTLGLFDLIIGSDVLYEPDHPKLISSFIDRHAKNDTKIIIVDPGRREHRQFTRMMVERGYDVRADRPDNELAREIGFKGKVLTFSRQAGTSGRLMANCPCF